MCGSANAPRRCSDDTVSSDLVVTNHIVTGSRVLAPTAVSLRQGREAEGRRSGGPRQPVTASATHRSQQPRGTVMHIIVGVDKSEAARNALRWALRSALRRSATLEVVRSWMYPSVSLQELVTADEMDRVTEAELRSTVEDVACEVAAAGDLEIRTTVLRGPAHQSLVGLIERCQPSLVVVGRRGDDERVLPRPLGSVSRRVVDTAACPVVVVSHDHGHATSQAGPNGEAGPNTMVVFDGSEHAIRALRWAVEFAQPAGKILVAHVIGFVGGVDEMVQRSDRAEGLLDGARAVVASGGLTATLATSYGDPRRVLEEIAEQHGADLIVIGPRGVGGVAKLVMGTVAEYLIQYGDRPVAVIPPSWEGRSG